MKGTQMSASNLVWRMTRSELFPFTNEPLIQSMFLCASEIRLKGLESLRGENFKGGVELMEWEHQGRVNSKFEQLVSEHLRNARNSVILTFGNTLVTITSVDGSNFIFETAKEAQAQA